MPGEIDELGDRVLRLLPPELGEVTTAELGEALWTMPVPLTELRTRRQILAPLVELGRVRAQAPRPPPVDQYPFPVAGAGRIVRALDRDLVR